MLLEIFFYKIGQKLCVQGHYKRMTAKDKKLTDEDKGQIEAFSKTRISCRTVVINIGR